ncbi:RNase adapter RapZ [Aestuariispira insulae]|uniref:UPF0042 nucleotide-binding protein n=1 Tax=Aestuariispira insulae TaxID=1461337 RepID=A0A3D9HQ24_9PROT|nr:RNase adapter RapZ [Aestuariispira insulae]RED51411.1 UPF0042 nucleotide-binding protein [Aestuariispira insulae]
MTEMEKPRLMLVTGMSGAGRTTALRALEDCGFDVVDNLPLSLLSRLAAYEAEAHGLDRPLAVGIDIRRRDFSVEAIQEEMDRLHADSPYDVSVLYIDCDEGTLIGRFKETRRPHPLSQDRPVADGIRMERQMMRPLLDRADYVIDTSGLTVWQFRDKVSTLAGADQSKSMTVSVSSFSYRKGIPRDADLVFDVRFLRNPHYDPELKPFTGRDKAVGDYVAADPDFPGFFGALTGLLRLTLPRYATEGKSHLAIAVGCTGGQHRSVYLAERLTKWVRENSDFQANVFHIELEKA